MKRLSASFPCCVLLVAQGCASRFIEIDPQADLAAFTVEDGIHECAGLMGEYQSAIRRLEGMEEVAKYGVMLAGIGGVYEGVTGSGSNSDTLAGYAAAGALFYAADQYLIRRPTRSEIYNNGIGQLLCIIENAPKSDRDRLVQQLDNTKTPRQVIVDLLLQIAQLEHAFSTANCRFASVPAALASQRESLEASLNALNYDGLSLVTACQMVAVNVSTALNKDTPTTSDISAFLSSFSIDVAPQPIQETPPQDDDITKGVNICAQTLANSLAVQRKVEIIHAIMQGSGSDPDCVKPIESRLLRIAGRSPFTLKKGSNLDIPVTGGTGKVALSAQSGGPDKPGASYDENSRRISITSGEDTVPGAYVFTLSDASGMTIDFVIIIEA